MYSVYLFYYSFIILFHSFTQSNILKSSYLILILQVLSKTICFTILLDVLNSREQMIYVYKIVLISSALSLEPTTTKKQNNAGITSLILDTLFFPTSSFKHSFSLAHFFYPLLNMVLITCTHIHHLDFQTRIMFLLINFYH